MSGDILLSVERLSMEFPLKGRETAQAPFKAVDDVSFSIARGETFGLVGESGCGKTTTGKCVLGITRPSAGRIVYKGVELSSLSRRDFRLYRRQLQLIFQDPYGSLDPRQSAFAALREAIALGGRRLAAQDMQRRVEELLETVELGAAMGARYPHEMSGGQRQRLGIARALACEPELIVCDEPVSALDVSIQAQIVNLFKSVQNKLGVTYLFIAHDLAVVRHISDRIGVMYRGRLVEINDSRSLYENPLHPYTRALLSAIPLTDYYEEQKRARIVLQGKPTESPGCPFAQNCSAATGECTQTTPALRLVSGNRHVACHNA